MKVSINAGGREVEIECDGVNVTYSDVADKALQVWRGTEGAKNSEGPGSHGRSGVVEPRAGVPDGH